jgi:hypothetical protein
VKTLDILWDGPDDLCARLAAESTSTHETLDVAAMGPALTDADYDRIIARIFEAGRVVSWTR